MKPIAHIASGAVMGGIAWAVTGNIGAALWCGLGNVASDTDHLLEYGVYCLKRRIRPCLSEFLSGTYFAAKGTLVILFHGYEHLFALSLAYVSLKQSQSLAALHCLAFTIGYGTHLLLDLIGNDCGIKGYSILYRATVKFSEHKICEGKTVRKTR